jgi:hypothetical protein
VQMYVLLIIRQTQIDLYFFGVTQRVGLFASTPRSAVG